MFRIKILALSLLFSIIMILFSSGTFLESNPPDALSVAVTSEDSRPIVILDPGHGGVDSGAVSIHGAEEKNVNLTVAKKLGEFLEAAGCRVIYTRQEDVILTTEGAPTRKTGDLLARVRVAKEYPQSTFISIHMNTLPQEKYSGIQVFYSDVNSASRALAQGIQNDVISLLQPDNHREAKDAKGKIFILDRIRQAAVLVECGFLSNRAEAEKLEQEDYQNKLAFVLSRSLLPFVLKK